MNKIFLILPIYLFGLIWSHDLKQSNSENVFLTNQGLKNYQRFTQDHHVGQIAIAKVNHIKLLEDPNFKLELERLNRLCSNRYDDECEIVSPLSLENNSLIKLKRVDSFAVLLIGTSKEGIRQLINEISQTPIWNQQGHAPIQFSGVPFTNLNLDTQSKSIKQILFPLFFLLTFLALLLIMRNLKDSLLFFIPALGSAGISLMGIKYFFGQSNLVLAIIPLLVFILNFVLNLHIYFAATKEHSLKKAIFEKKKPIVLMILTTFVGFFSLASSELGVIQSFGITSACLILITFVLTILWLFSIDSVVKPNRQDGSIPLKSLFKACNPHSTLIIVIVSIIGIALGSFAFNKIQILTDANQYFSKEDKIIHDMKSISKTFMGTPILEITIDKKLDHQEIIKLERLENEIKNDLPEDFLIISPNQIVKEVNLQYSHSFSLPDNQFAFRALLGKSPPVLASAYSNLENYRLTLFAPTMNVDQFEKTMSKIAKKFEKNNYSVKFNGIYYHLMTAQKSMIYTLLKSFLLSLTVIALIAYFVYRKLNVFFVILLVNTVPVFLTFLCYHLFNLSFNIATVMTFSISLGIIVDSTFHQIHALIDRKYDKEEYQSKVILPIFFGGCTLAIAFALFGFHSFLPIRQFGLSLSIIIIFGTYFDLKILPRFFKHCVQIIEE